MYIFIHLSYILILIYVDTTFQIYILLFDFIVIFTISKLFWYV